MALVLKESLQQHGTEGQDIMKHQLPSQPTCQWFVSEGKKETVLSFKSKYFIGMPCFTNAVNV